MKTMTAALLALTLTGAGAAGSAQADPPRYALPGIRYQVLASGPATGVQPTRSDQVTFRYVGKLADGTVFSTSPGGGAEASGFKVKELIPGISAALQLMRPGDRWRITVPAYLGYGRLGRPVVTTTPGASAQQAHGIPPNALLVFDIDLVSVAPASP